MTTVRLFVTGVAFGVLVSASALAQEAMPDCGGVDAPCTVPLGEFYIAAPQEPADETASPIVIYLHGGGSSGASLMRNRGIVDAMTARGYVVIAPNGAIPEGRDRPSWSFGSFRPPTRDEAAFMGELIGYAANAYGGDPDRVLLTGFSIGGSMVWRLACDAPEMFAAFAPIAGGFWRPFPEDCAGPVKLLHTHGWTDQTVPLEGRPLRPEIEQGDIWEGMQTWRRENGCAKLRADEFEFVGDFWHRIWTSCDEGTALEFVLHPGGHSIPPGWTAMTLDWFEEVTKAE